MSEKTELEVFNENCIRVYFLIQDLSNELKRERISEKEFIDDVNKLV